jgi:hypothetical protein
VANISTNAARGLPELQQHAWRDRPLLVVGGGPSLADYLPMLQALRPDCDVLAINGAYKHLADIGIGSNYFVMIDSREADLVHAERPLVATHHLLASQVHPKVFDALAGYGVTLFHLGTDTAREAIGATFSHLAAPIGMASVHAVYVGAALGYRQMYLFGYDFSHGAASRYAFDQPMNQADDTLTITLNGRTFTTTLAMARTAEQFANAVTPLMRQMEDVGGLSLTVCADGLLSAMIAAVNAPATAEREQAKYERMWQQDAYRKVSPGLDDAERALTELHMPSGSTIADLGCGTGRAAKWFETQGHHAIGVDIAANGLEEDVPFAQCALWDLEIDVSYGFCVDVLEHIPTERVRDTLRAIRDSVSVACYLNIDTIPDSMGLLIGERLHMTVMGAESWHELLREFWPTVERLPSNDRQAVFVCRR